MSVMRKSYDDEYYIDLEKRANSGDKSAETERDMLALEQRIETLSGRFESRRLYVDERLNSLEKLTKSRFECHAKHILDTEKKVDAAVKLSVVSLVIVVIHIIINLVA